MANILYVGTDILLIKCLQDYFGKKHFFSALENGLLALRYLADNSQDIILIGDDLSGITPQDFKGRLKNTLNYEITRDSDLAILENQINSSKKS